MIWPLTIKIQTANAPKKMLKNIHNEINANENTNYFLPSYQVLNDEDNSFGFRQT